MSAVDDPSERLAALCRHAGIRVGVAESLTAGRVASEIGRLLRHTVGTLLLHLLWLLLLLVLLSLLPLRLLLRLI